MNTLTSLLHSSIAFQLDFDEGPEGSSTLPYLYQNYNFNIVEKVLYTSLQPNIYYLQYSEFNNMLRGMLTY